MIAIEGDSDITKCVRPSDTKIGDLICGFPNSSFGLIFGEGIDGLQFRGEIRLVGARLQDDEDIGRTWGKRSGDPPTVTDLREGAGFLRLKLTGILQIKGRPDEHLKAELGKADDTANFDD